MFDRHLRSIKDRGLSPVVRRLAPQTGPTTITFGSLILALATVATAATGRPWWSLITWWASRLLDGLDGPVARARGEADDFGGYLDLVVDTVGYASIPLGVAIGANDQSTWIAVAVLEATFFVNSISWSVLAAVLEKRGHGAASTGEATTVTMPPALIEGTETIVLFSLFLALPALATPVFAVMSGLVMVNVGQRLWWARRTLRSDR